MDMFGKGICHIHSIYGIYAYIDTPKLISIYMAYMEHLGVEHGELWV